MLSDNLKKIYSSNVRTLEHLETVEINHSRFKNTIYLTNDADNHTLKLDNGTLQEFSSYGFKVVLPEKGSNQQDLQFVFDNVAGIAIGFLEEASQDYSEPIRLTYRIYIKGLPDQQSTPLVLNLTNISLTAKNVSARATRSDLINRKFPFGKNIYFDNRFGGLI